MNNTSNEIERDSRRISRLCTAALQILLKIIFLVCVFISLHTNTLKINIPMYDIPNK